MQSIATFHSEDYWFIFQNDRLLLIKSDSKLSLPREPFYQVVKASLLKHHYLGIFNHANCYCAEIEESFLLPDSIERIPVKAAFEVVGLDWYLPIVKAYSIITWDKNTQFCSRCGHKTELTIGTFEHNCKACGLSIYPRISPSIIVRIKKENQILMARSPHFPPGAYGLIAGFIEAGESIEEAIHREVKEEVNLEIAHLTYFGSQAWPFPDVLMIGFTANYLSGEIIIDDNEIETAGWYGAHNLPGRPSSNISIAQKLIDDFIDEQKQKP